MNNKITVLLTTMLLLLAGIASWYTLQIVKNNTKKHIQKPHNPDAFALNATYIETNNEGTISYIIKTPKFTHYPYLNSATFQEPNIVVTKEQQQPFVITAKSGTSTNGTEVIHLKDNVKLHQQEGQSNKELTITTQKATVYLNKKYISTDDYVTIKRPGITTTATGANADLNKKIINLLSDVKEIYIPQTK